MNLPSGLEGAPPWLFWTVFFSGIFLGILIHGWIMKGQEMKSGRK
jgi:hypothetical protein